MRRSGTIRARLTPEAQRSIDTAELMELLNDDRFRRYLWRWLGKSGIYQTTYSGSTDATSFREGRRALGLDMLTECLTAREDALRMILTSGEGAPGVTDRQERSTPGDDDAA